MATFPRPLAGVGSRSNTDRGRRHPRRPISSTATALASGKFAAPPQCVCAVCDLGERILTVRSGCPPSAPRLTRRPAPEGVTRRLRRPQCVSRQWADRSTRPVRSRHKLDGALTNRVPSTSTSDRATKRTGCVVKCRLAIRRHFPRDAGVPRRAQSMGLALRGYLVLVWGATAERRNLLFRSDLGLPRSRTSGLHRLFSQSNCKRVGSAHAGGRRSIVLASDNLRWPIRAGRVARHGLWIVRSYRVSDRGLVGSVHGFGVRESGTNRGTFRLHVGQLPGSAPTGSRPAD